MGDRPFHHGKQADSGLPIRAIREKLSSRFGPIPGGNPVHMAGDDRGPLRMRRPETLRPRPIRIPAEPQPAAAGTTLLSRLNSLFDISRRLRQSSGLPDASPDVAKAAQACVQDVQDRIAVLQETLGMSAGPSDRGDEAMREVLDAQRQLADAQFTLVRAQHALIEAGLSLLHGSASRGQTAPTSSEDFRSGLAKGVARTKSL